MAQEGVSGEPGSASSLEEFVRTHLYLLDEHKKWLLRGIAITLMLIGWESADLFTVSKPSVVFSVLIHEWFVTYAIPEALLQALRQAVLGYGVAIAVGIPVGYIIGLSSIAKNMLDPIIDALYVVPSIALVPLLIIWFGLTVTAKAILVILAAIFVIIVNTEAGASETPQGLVDAARVYGASRFDIYYRVYLRHSMPYVLTGLRLGSGRAVRGMVTAEIFVFAGKLGGGLLNSGARFDIPLLIAYILSISLTGIVALQLLRIIELSVLDYRESAL